MVNKVRGGIYLIFFLISILFSGRSMAQQVYFQPNLTIENDFTSKFTVLNTENGLSHNLVNDLYQDHIGYIWIGTARGLNRFDGYKIKNYYHEKSNPVSLSHNHINDIVEDSAGVMYVATSYGLNRYDRLNDCFIPTGFDSLSPFFMPDKVVTALLMDEQGILWANSQSGYLYRFDFKDSTMEYFVHFPSLDQRTSGQTMQLDGDSIWIFHRGRTAIFNRTILQFSYFSDIHFNKNLSTADALEDADQSLSFFIKDTLGNYYFGNHNGVGLIYQPKEKSLNLLHLASFYSCLQASDGSYWVGGYTFGTAQYLPLKNKFVLNKTVPGRDKAFPSNRVWDIIEDRSGNIWCATINGVAKLCATNKGIRHIQNTVIEKNTLVSNKVQSLCQRKNGDIWIATEQGISVFNTHWKPIAQYKANPEIKTTLLHKNVRAVYEDEDGIMWVGYWAGVGFSRFNDQNHTFKHFTHNPNPKQLSGYDWYVGFVEDTTGAFYTLQWGSHGIDHFDKENEEFTVNMMLRKSTFYGSTIKFLTVYNNAIWSSISEFNLKSGTSCYFVSKDEIFKNAFAKGWNNPKFVQVTRLLPAEFPNSIQLINGNLYWLTNRGLLNYLPQKRDFYRYPFDLNVKHIAPSPKSNHFYVAHTKGLDLMDLSTGKAALVLAPELFQNENIQSLLKTNDALWVGTSKALYKILDKDVLHGISQVKKVPFADMELSVNALEQDSSGNLWLGTSQGLFRLKDNSVKQRYTPNTYALSSFFINDVLCDSLDQLWVATLNGLNLYLPNKDDFNSFNHDEMQYNSLSSNVLYSLSEGEQSVFIGTSRGFSRIDKKSHQVFSLEKDTINSLLTNRTTCGICDSRGNIWMGFDEAHNFVVRLNPYTKELKYFYDEPYLQNAFRGDKTYSIFEDRAHNIWIATSKGLNRYNPKTDSFLFIGPEEALPAQEVFSLAQDQSDYLWLSTAKGLIRLHPHSLQMDIFDKLDGIPFFTFYDNAAIALQDGKLLFGGRNGLMVIDPLYMQRDSAEPTLVFSNFQVQGKNFPVALEILRYLELKSHENSLVFDLAVLDFINTPRVRFAYKLENYHTDWQELTRGKNQIVLSNLPFGEYTLKVKAANHDGIWGKQVRTVKIVIHPPWYQTVWAYVGFGLILLVLIYLIFRLRVYQLKERSKKLKLEVSERTKEVLAKNEELAEKKIADLINRYQLESVKANRKEQEELRMRIASELHDGVGGSLTGIKLYIESLMRKNPSPDLQLLLKDLDKTYHQVRNISHDLVPPEFEDYSIKEIIADYVDQLQDRSHLNIEFLVHPLKGWDKLEQDLQVEIYRISQELLTNAIKHAYAERITLQFLMHSDMILLQVEDNGVGFNTDSIKEGIGLHSLHHRVKRLNGKIEIDSSPAKGTILHIEIPIKK